MDEARERELEEMLGSDPELERTHDEHDPSGNFVPPEADFAEIEDNAPAQDTLGGGILSYGDLD